MSAGLATGPIDVATLGEGLTVLDPTVPGPLRHVGSFAKRVGGAEVNVAVALARLGHRAAWAGRLGDDPFGREILSLLRGEGVETGGATLDPGAPTGVYFKERGALGQLRVYYYRTGSAASRARIEDLDVDALLGARILHLTGITPALSNSCAALTEALIAEAVARGVLVSFDANVRWRLWGDRDPAAWLAPLVAQADFVFCSEEEAALLFGGSEPDELRAVLADRRAQAVVVHGEHGAFAVEVGGVTERAGHRVEVLDTVGAGDAFVAGFLSGRLRGWDTGGCLDLANACGACAVTVSGDVESMPDEAAALALVEGRRGRER